MTSASAFFANYLSEIPALANFGLLTALVICTNYVWLLMTIPVSLGAPDQPFDPNTKGASSVSPTRPPACTPACTC